MTQIIRWDPFREMMQLRSARLFDDAFFAPRGYESAAWRLALDVAETENGFVIKASIPGIEPKDLDISLADNTLTIKGQTQSEKDIEAARYHLRERRYGNFTRSVTFPAPVNANAVEASYENGVLTLSVPKAEDAKPRKISVRTAPIPEPSAN